MTESSDAAEPTVLVRRHGAAGRLTLNRPRAINALDLEMIGVIDRALDAWEDDPEVRVVILDGAGDRGLCAGGDVRGLHDQIVAGHPERTAEFFRAEYALNARLAEYRAPVVALADGITMGGGIGLAGHAAVRVVTERSKLAMPETRIGFTPDVGGTWLLGRAPGQIGEYLAVTGTVMDASDAVFAGFADHVVPAAELDALREALAAGVDPAEAVTARAVDPGPSTLAADRAWIDYAFVADTVADIVERLRSHGEAAPARAADTMGELSPTGMAVTLQSVRRCRERAGLRDALAQEYGLVMWFVHTQPDLVEGIRAQLVDKTRDARWIPSGIDEVGADTIAAAFSFDPATPLWA